MLQYRKLVDKAIYINRNELLCERVESFLEQTEFEKIHTFLSIKRNNEPDLSSLHKDLWANDVKVVISKTNFDRKEMKHYLFTDQTKLVKNEMQIPEPVGAVETPISDVDIIFIPLLLADQHGNRIGYGGGYYDRLLKETNAIKIGLSLSGPVNKIIQTEEWDIPLNYLITPFKIHTYG